MQNTFNPSDLLNEFAAADVLGLSPKTLQNWRIKGGGPVFTKLGSGKRAPVRYRVENLREFIERGQTTSTAAHQAKAGAR